MCTFNELKLILQPINNTVNSNVNAYRSMDAYRSRENVHTNVSKKGGNVFSEKAIVGKFVLQTGLSEDGVRTLWRSFNKYANNGNVNKLSFLEIMKNVGCKDLSQMELLFNAFDDGKCGALDFKQICVGFAILTKGTNDDKMRMAFKCFDINQSGKISKAELYMIFKSILAAKSIRHTTKEINDWVVECFAKYDIGNKGYLVYEEFKVLAERRMFFMLYFCILFCFETIIKYRSEVGSSIFRISKLEYFMW